MDIQNSTYNEWLADFDTWLGGDDFEGEELDCNDFAELLSDFCELTKVRLRICVRIVQLIEWSKSLITQVREFRHQRETHEPRHNTNHLPKYTSWTPLLYYK